MAKILKGLEKKLKKFTRLTTIKFKAPRAHEIKKALEEISNSIQLCVNTINPGKMTSNRIDVPVLQDLYSKIYMII